MRTLLLVLLMSLSAAPALACSCLFDERTLEQRINDADRVIRVRVVAAELVEGTGEARTIFSPGADSIRYRLSLLETIKGEQAAVPTLSGLAGTGGGDCTVRLPIGDELLLFVGADDEELGFSYCGMPFEAVLRFGESEPMVQAVRDFVSSGKAIHNCDNLRRVPSELVPTCKARRQEWREKARSERAAAG